MLLKATLGKLAYISPPAHEYVITDTMSPGKLVRRCQKKCTIWKGFVKYIRLVTVSKPVKLFNW